MFFESKNNLYLFQYIPKNEFIKDKKFLQEAVRTVV